MGGDGKSGGGGTQNDYFGSIAGVVCQGPLDFIWGLLINDNLVWPTATIVDANQDWADQLPKSGHWSTNDIIAYNGIVWEATANTAVAPPSSHWKRFRRTFADVAANPYKITVEGFGDAYLYWGTADQVLDTVNEQFLAANGHPAYRHRAVLAFRKFLFGTEVQSAPNAVVLGGRAAVQTLITGDAVELDTDWQCNPWCFLAEILTHPVIGLGLPDSLFDAATWQAEADWCLARHANTYLSPIYDRQQQVRSVIADLMQYMDGFIYWTPAGTLAAGHWPHGEAPPAFDDSTTIDFHDLESEVDWDALTWRDTTNATTVNYNDINYAFNSVPANASNLLNRIITRRVQTKQIDRPFVVRAAQAAAMATEDAKLSGQPTFGNELVVRAEKATAIKAGVIFRLTHDALSISIACRCLKKVFSKPPTGTVTLTYQTEPGIAELPFSPTPIGPTAGEPPPPARITNFQLIQLPSQLTITGQDYVLACLAARNNGLTSSLGIWWKFAEVAESFQQLASQNGFAVFGTITAGINTQTVTNEAVTASSTAGDTYNLANQDIWNLTLQWGGGWTAGIEGVDYIYDADAGTVTVLVGGAITNTSAVRVSYSVIIPVQLDGDTPIHDIEEIAASLTADQINSGTLLLFIFKASNEKQFEILSVKSLTATGGGAYNVAVQRSKYGSLPGGDGTYEFTTDDRAFFIKRSVLVSFTNEVFADIAAAAETATFRLTPATAWRMADLADVYDAGTNPNGLTTELSYTFGDPYAPTIAWVNLQANTGVGSTFEDIADFTTPFDPDTVFRLTFAVSDLNGDLIAFSSSYIPNGGTSVVVSSEQLPGTNYINRTMQFTLHDIGEYHVAVTAQAATGRTASQFLTEVGDPDEQTILIQSGSPSNVMPPVIVISSPGKWSPTHPSPLLITLTCGTAGSSILYQVGVAGGPPDPTWAAHSTYTAPFYSTSYTQYIYVKATHAGLTDSAVVNARIVGHS